MITDVVSRAFPGREVARIRKQSHRNSRVYVVGLDGEGGEPAAAVKLSRDQSPDQVSREFLSMSKFFEAPRGPRVSCPEPQYYDPQYDASAPRKPDVPVPSLLRLLPLEHHPDRIGHLPHRLPQGRLRLHTPNMDLGRFRFGLELIKQYPTPGLFCDGWCLDRLYSRFLQSYSRETGTTPGSADMDLIECFAGVSILRAQDTGRKGRFHWQPRLEKLYLKAFCRG